MSSEFYIQKIASQKIKIKKLQTKIRKKSYINNPLNSCVEWCGGVDKPPPIYSTKEAATSPTMHTN